MMLPTIEIIDEYVMENSAFAALKEMREDGYYINVHVLHHRIKHLNAAGIRRSIPHNERLANIDSYNVEISRAQSQEGCRNLLEAQIRAGQVMGVPMAAWEARHGVAA